MGRILINCDFGENESSAQTSRLLDYVDAASVCCGVHAGSLAKSRETLQMVAERSLLVGAHPGLADEGGRGAAVPSVRDFREQMEAQITSFIALADEVEVWIDYVKLHGSLYHLVERDEAYAEAYLELLLELPYELAVFASAGGVFGNKAKSAGLKVWREGFFDRGYRADGSLVPRTDVGAARSRCRLQALFGMRRIGLMDTADGSPGFVGGHVS